MRAEFVRACSRLSDLPSDDIPEVAVAGRSNCGKSSLLNALSKHNALARTSSTPGRTRQIVIFRLQLAARVLLLADLPGYGFAKVSKQLRREWGDLVGSYIEQRPNLRLILLLNDIRRPPQQQERDLVRWASDVAIPALVVLTKADKLNKSNRFAAIRRAKDELALGEAPLAVSVRDSSSIDLLRERIVQHPAIGSDASLRTPR